MLFTIAFYKVS